MDSKEYKLKVIKSAQIAVNELLKVIEDPIIAGDGDDLSADKLKNAAATKRLAIEDAFIIIERIENERKKLESPEETDKPKEDKEIKKSGGFAEKHAS